MEKIKFTKNSIYELMSKISQEREKAVESVSKHDGAMNICKYLIEKFDFEDKEQNVNSNGLQTLSDEPR